VHIRKRSQYMIKITGLDHQLNDLHEHTASPVWIKGLPQQTLVYPGSQGAGARIEYFFLTRYLLVQKLGKS
jgi:hypothetical protein